MEWMLPRNLSRRALASKARPAHFPTTLKASPRWATSAGLIRSSWWPWKPPAVTSNRLLRSCRSKGLPVAILNPRAVRQFAQSMGSLEKTDRIDAGMIAWYAEVKKSPPVCLAPENQQHLRALVTRLRQLTDIRTAQLNQQRLVTDRAVQASFKKLLALLARQISELEQGIAALLEKDPLWRELNQAFRTIKGVADRTVARLMAEMPEIGTLSNKTISKLAGVAPLANDSGKHQGKRAVRGGRAAVREILFIVASVVGRHEPDFIAFRERLRAAGKPPKVVRIALAHKLLVRLNAKAREVRQRLATLQPNPAALPARIR